MEFVKDFIPLLLLSKPGAAEFFCFRFVFYFEGITLHPGKSMN